MSGVRLPLPIAPLWDALTRVKRNWSRARADAHTAAFMRFCRRKWPRREATGDAVVLVNQFAWRPCICANAYLTNYLTRQHGARIETSSFVPQKDPLTQRIYASFGAKPGLGWSATDRFTARAKSEADTVFHALKTKEEVFAICIDGLVVGDLIYDSYLRYHLKATVDLHDPRLRHLIGQAFRIALACAAYFRDRRIVAYIASDAPYIESGIPHRLAIRHRVPIYTVEYNPFTVHTMDGVMRPGDPRDHRNWPSKVAWGNHDRRIFASFLPEAQAEARARARQRLDDRFSGARDSKLLPGGNSSFAEPAKERIFPKDGPPRMLVLLHDFCDAPNALRWNIFPDFYEWLHFLLGQAQKTKFAWYVKPHPHRHFDAKKAAANHAIVETFKSQYPAVHFLEPTASNRQLIAEGVTAMFTVHGSAGHEFAYHGVPVVNAGDNHHIEYGFNLHPRTVEEYELLIDKADSLPNGIDREEIEEFFYMHAIYPFQKRPSGVDLIPEPWRGSPDQATRESGTEIFKFVAEADSAERDRQLQTYLDAYFTPATPAVQPRPAALQC